MCRGHNAGDFAEITITNRVRVDQCLAPEILWLNDQGVRTVSSCCGHGKEEGTILIMIQDAERAKKMGYHPEPYYLKDGTPTSLAKITPRFMLPVERGREPPDVRVHG